MRFFLLTGLLSILLLAQESSHPKVYEALGNEIYTNVVHIEKLKSLSEYEGYREKIDNYSSKVKKTKELGFAVESGDRANVKLDYLQRLREHTKVNDYFVRSANSALKSAIQTKNNSLFSSMINSGLIDTRAQKKQIMSYYNANKVDIDPKGVIQNFIDEDIVLKKKRWKPKTKKQLQEEKIARLRKNDELDKKALEKKLSDELKAKKEQIRRKQEKELFN